MVKRKVQVEQEILSFVSISNKDTVTLSLAEKLQVIPMWYFRANDVTNIFLIQIW